MDAPLQHLPRAAAVLLPPAKHTKHPVDFYFAHGNPCGCTVDNEPLLPHSQLLRVYAAAATGGGQFLGVGSLLRGPTRVTVRPVVPVYG